MLSDCDKNKLLQFSQNEKTIVVQKIVYKRITSAVHENEATFNEVQLTPSYWTPL